MKRLIFLVLLLAGCTSTAGPISDSPTPPPSTVSASTIPKVSSSPSQSLMPISGITMVHDPGQVTGSLKGPCHMLGDSSITYRPDPACTPGSVDPTMTEKELCDPMYSTSMYRPSEAQTSAAKWKIVVPAYGLTSTFHGELDHLISLELGGSNDLSNLWPEPGSIPNPKDKIENELHADVCSGKITLSEAQAEIANNWTVAHA